MGENNCKIYLAKSEPIIKFYQSGKASDSFRIVLRIQNSAAAPKAKMLRISRKELRTTQIMSLLCPNLQNSSSHISKKSNINIKGTQKKEWSEIANDFHAKKTRALQLEKGTLLDRNRLAILKNHEQTGKGGLLIICSQFLTVHNDEDNCQKQLLGNRLSTKEAPSQQYIIK